MEDPSFRNTEWELTAHRNAHGEIVPVIPGSRITIIFKPNSQLYSYGGCNSYYAGYHARNKILTIGDLENTLKLCEDRIVDQEDSYIGMLKTVTGYEIEDNTLILKNEAGEDMAWYKQSQR